MVFKPMKRREVIAALRAQGCYSIRNKGDHEIYQCPCGSHKTAVPRHTRVTAGVVSSVGAQMACLPKGWLQ